jgi:hypothetical protein
MLLTAAVAKTPNIAVTVTVTGAPMSWLKTGARLVLAKRVQSDCLCSVRFCIFYLTMTTHRILLPVHPPATELMANSILKDLSALEICFAGLGMEAPPFAARAQMNSPNIAAVTM